MADKPKEPVKKNPLQDLIDKMPAYATKADLVQAIRTIHKQTVQSRYQQVAATDAPTPPTDETPA